jgi:hypothetical protein
MNPITRAELQQFESKANRDRLIIDLRNVYQYVVSSARSGKNQIFIETVEIPKPKGTAQQTECCKKVPHILRSSDIQACLEILKELFPDSKMILQETWVDVTPTNRVLKKGILIDWS